MHYTIYLVSGLNPVFFTAEQDDPSKGITLTSEGLPELKQMIDDTLGRAKKLKINMWQGKPENTAFPEVSGHINANGIYYEEFVIVVRAANYDIKSIELTVEINNPLRRSKRYRKGRAHWNLAKFLKHRSY